MPPLSLVGTLPLSVVNIGIAAGLPGVSAEAAKLQADITDLTPAVQGQIDVSSNFPPNVAAYAATVAAALNPAELAACMTPANVTFAAAEANTAVVAKLGFIQGQLGLVSSIRASLAGGIEAGSITGWSYAGRCSGFGPMLEPQTKLGFGELGPADEVQGILVVTQSFTSWGQFAKSVSADPGTGATAADTRLTPHGRRSGAQWNTGVASLVARLDAYLGQLRGMEANLKASLRFSVGADLPSPSVVVDAGLEVSGSIDVLLDNLVNVQTDIDGAIGVIQGKVDASLSLVGELSGQLAAGGFAVWAYSGRADGFGKAVTSALVGGLPSAGGPGALVYGLALAGAGPSMSAFSGIFRTS